MTKETKESSVATTSRVCPTACPGSNAPLLSGRGEPCHRQQRTVVVCLAASAWDAELTTSSRHCTVHGKIAVLFFVTVVVAFISMENLFVCAC